MLCAPGHVRCKRRSRKKWLWTWTWAPAATTPPAPPFDFNKRGQSPLCHVLIMVAPPAPVPISRLPPPVVNKSTCTVTSVIWPGMKRTKQWKRDDSYSANIEDTNMSFVYRFYTRYAQHVNEVIIKRNLIKCLNCLNKSFEWSQAKICGELTSSVTIM